MSEVDYSRFIYNREKEESKISLEKISKPKKKKKSNFLFVVFVLLLCFSLILLATDIFSNGKIVATISYSLKKNDYNFYIVVVKKQDKSSAFSQSLVTKQGGGAGYIHQKDDEIFVLYSAFCDYSDAEKVATKNTDTTVLTVGIKGKNQFNTTMQACIEDYCKIIMDYDEGLLTDSAFYGRSKNIYNTVFDLQTKNLNTKQKELCAYVLTEINSLSASGGVKSEFLSKNRYFLCGWIISFCFG